MVSTDCTDLCQASTHSNTRTQQITLHVGESISELQDCCPEAGFEGPQSAGQSAQSHTNCCRSPVLCINMGMRGRSDWNITMLEKGARLLRPVVRCPGCSYCGKGSYLCCTPEERVRARHLDNVVAQGDTSFVCHSLHITCTVFPALLHPSHVHAHPL